MPRLDKLRTLRASLLSASDWTQVADSPLTDEQRAAWAEYRQALRDLPADGLDPRTANWPTPPTEEPA